MNDREIVEGCLLGDGSLRKRANMRNAYFITSKTGLGHLDRLEQIKQALGYDNTTVKPFPNRGGYKSKNKETLWLWTRTNTELTDMYCLWYPSGKKVMPSALELSPRSLASFFMDDGSSSWLGTGVMVSFYPQGFTLREIERLGRLIRGFGFNCYSNYGTPSAMPRLVIRDKASVRMFMDTVQPYVTPSFAYKLKYPGEVRAAYDGQA